MTAQHIINSIEFARKSLEIRGTIARSEMQRAKDLLTAETKSLDWRLTGELGADKKARLHLSLTGDVGVPCQRCLEPMIMALNINADFVLVNDESEIPSEEDDVEDHDYIVAEAEMDVLQLVEDEILLALPYAPKHEIKDCAVKAEENALKAPNPFAALRDFKVVKS
ncbi:MAG: YceD family protein [Candidatus Methylopumilus sp.]